MDAEQARKLREPFDAGSIGKLPRVYCRDCREAPNKTCNQHRKVKCQVCRNNITDAHLHLDYVGHAEITDRLLMVDADWTWEPVAFGAEGLPLIDREGGLWIRLTVAGVTRLGYGDAEGKRGPSAIKEAIGDALRNAAMRFGVGLDLWGATYKGDDPDPHETEPTEPRVHWDPVDQAAERQVWEQEIADKKTPEDLKVVGARIAAARDKGRLSPATVEHLSNAYAARKAELTLATTEEKASEQD